MTAAHCKGAFKKYALVGAYAFDSTEYGAQKIGTRAEIRDERYNRNTEYDFMVVPLKRKSKHAYVQLNYKFSNPQTGDKLTVIGTGVTDVQQYDKPKFLVSDGIREFVRS